ncbi:MAG: thioredoxin family protein [Bacteroidetes bacterium]|nr:thioredoxin family protein [Bacteroidota bacterium]
MKNFSIYALLSILVISTSSFILNTTDAGYKVGDVAGDFKLTNIDGKKVSLNDYPEAKGVILVFTCNHCPFSVAYEDRIIGLHNKYVSKGYPVVAINSNDAKAYPDDSFENMVVRAKDKAFPFRYLHDESQEIARNYGATRTPHVYVLNKEKESWVVRYIGAIDDNTDSPAEVTKKYVETAVNELLEGKPVSTSFTKAIGCSIKWKK